MNCDKIRPFLDEFAAGELTSPQKERVQEHLVGCPLCQKELSAITRTVRLLAEFGEVKEPPHFLERVRQRIETRARRPIFSRLLPRTLFGRAVLSGGFLLIAALGFWTYYTQIPTVRPVRVERDQARTKKGIEVTRSYRGNGIPEEELGESMLGVGVTPKEGEDRAKIELDEHAWVETAKESFEYGKAADKLSETGEREAGGAFAKWDAYRKAGKTPGGEGGRGAESALREEIAQQGEEDTFGRLAAIEKEREVITGYKAGAAVEGRLETKAEEKAPAARHAALARLKAEYADKEQPEKPPSAATGVPHELSPEAAQRGRDLGTGLAKAGGEVVPAAPLEAKQKTGEPGIRGKAERKDMPGETDGDLHEPVALEEAGKEGLALTGAEFKVAEAPRDEKAETALKSGRPDGYDNINDARQTQWGMAGQPQSQALALDEAGGVLLGQAVTLQVRDQVEGAESELVIGVKDTQKALPEIKRMLTELGGAILEPAAEHARMLYQQAPPPDPNVLLVKMDFAAFQSFQERFLRRPEQAKPSGPAIQMPERGQAHQRNVEQRRAVTFRIRLVEISRQEHQDQPAEK